MVCGKFTYFPRIVIKITSIVANRITNAISYRRLPHAARPHRYVCSAHSKTPRGIEKHSTAKRCGQATHQTRCRSESPETVGHLNAGQHQKRTPEHAKMMVRDE